MFDLHAQTKFWNKNDQTYAFQVHALHKGECLQRREKI